MEFLKALGIEGLNKGTSTGSEWIESKGEKIISYSPADGKEIGTVISTTREEYDQVIETASQAFLEWRTWPAPRAGAHGGPYAFPIILRAELATAQ